VSEKSLGKYLVHPFTTLATVGGSLRIPLRLGILNILVVETGRGDSGPISRIDSGLKGSRRRNPRQPNV
jgi:hypothetical protein